MKVTKKDVLQAFGIITAIQPNFLNHEDNERAELLKNIWYEFFKEEESEVFMEAVKQATLKCKYNILPAHIKDEIDLIKYGDFNPLSIWEKNLPLLNTMYNNNQDLTNWYDKGGYERQVAYFDAWQKLDPTLKVALVSPLTVDRILDNEYELASFKSNYLKTALGTENEFRSNPELRRAVTSSSKRVDLDTLKQELKTLSFNEVKRLK